MKKTTPAVKKLTLNRQTVRELSLDRLDQALGAGTASCTCSNNTCLNQLTGCKLN